ncbi:NfeD family protein [Draconibacterium halophilum]|uniref:Nodulation protein NfeD n=1 Tax=Draconibacterium halophilum TaxID=2706887 RepID=A0A6C0RBX3_9BACT|nr:NfeD family protein [Draconibacterium halophilum]QIA07567.1 nodulation protein NfeD [Draconibacterium halophilum]
MKLKNFWILLFVVATLAAFAQEANKKKVFLLNIKSEITPATRRQMSQAFMEADSVKADVFLIHMNTYGGTVVDADSIRTRILQSKIPVYVFIDNNAASAGALISIACDGIYMRPGGSIGAATVVNQTGEAMPDKYQSYMRSTMRATAEAHGKDTTITAGGDTIVSWFRDPKIAEAMVDERIYIEGVSDSGRVLTFTPSEAMEHGFCEGTAETVDEVLQQVGINEYDLFEYEPTFIEKIIGFLVLPMISGLLIMAIIGGIYFEMQSPGIGFPLGIAILAALLYFMPLYLEGLAEHWEIALFIVGLILVAVEIFVIPGFGFAGAAGITFVFIGLVLSLIDNVNFDFEGVQLRGVGTAIATVVIGIFGGFILALYLGKRMFTAEHGMFKNFALNTVQQVNEGFVSVETKLFVLKGKKGFAQTVLRPGGKVNIEGEIYDAVAVTGFIDKDEEIVVTKVESMQLYVELDEE